MTLTQKEMSILKDLRTQEELCIKKYTRYAESACDPALSALFNSIKATEQEHLKTVCEMLAGTEVKPPMSSGMNGSQNAQGNDKAYPCSECDKQADAYLCQDALAMEKHVSSVYDTGIFEFCSPVLRQTLNHIQKEEQEHGEKIFSYMSKHGMYNVN